ncbi:MAG: nucleotidyltransferase domain-containing protein [Chitinispirillales bacterium]|jgi:predicted nucleotidyltransferase|nr:nucleotidyltransferase domain-containing protein [Chitinispirillales bacterium]
MNIETINALEEAMKHENLLKKHHLERIGVFGSFARGEEANDIDFYVDSEDYDFKNLLNLKNDLEKITSKEVDIMLKKYANPIILHRAEKDMKYVTQ